MQPRYFIAITLPEPFSWQVSELQKQLYLTSQTMEPLVPHITLLHPSILETLAPSHFVPKIKQVADQFLPFEIRLAQTALFDKHVFHITIDSPELVAMHEKLLDLLPDKIRAEYLIGREFTPHITLIQAKPRQKLDEVLISRAESLFKSLLPYTFTAARVTRFTWERPRSYRLETV